MSNYLADRRKKLKLTQKQIADAVEVSEATVSRWESGEIANMRRDRIHLYANILKTTANFIMTGESENFSLDILYAAGFELPPTTIKKPLVGNIACGAPIEAAENTESYVDVPDNINCDFCLRCKGDSMVDAKIQNGDIVYIRKQPNVENGEIAAVRIGNEATLKRVYKSDNSVILMPANANCPPLTFSGESLNDITIEGKVVGFTHRF